MDWMNQIGGLLQQYQGGNAGQEPADVHNDFDQVAQSAPASALANGIAGAFRSDQTPPFAQMAGQLFSNASGQQRAGLLNTLISAAGPAVVGQVLGGGGAGGLGQMLGGGGGLGQILGGLGGGSQNANAADDNSQEDNGQDDNGQNDNSQLTPEQADQVSPDQVQELASHAERQNPGVVDEISNIVAQQPGLVKTLGPSVLSAVLGHLG